MKDKALQVSGSGHARGQVHITAVGQSGMGHRSSVHRQEHIPTPLKEQTPVSRSRHLIVGKEVKLSSHRYP